jgi:hypothetical protein
METDWFSEIIRKWLADCSVSRQPPRVVEINGRVLPRYSGAHLREIRKSRGVGRPPRRAAA